MLPGTIFHAFQLPVAKVLGNDETPEELGAEGISSVQNEKMIGLLALNHYKSPSVSFGSENHIIYIYI